MHKAHFNQPPVVYSIHGLSGIIDVVSPDASVTVGADGNNDLTLQAPGSGGGGTAYYTFAAVSGATALVTGHGYIASSASIVPFTLPSTAAVGDHFKILGFGAGGWTLGQNSGQTVHYGNVDTTTGAGGSIASQNQYDNIEIICVQANTDFVITAAQGNHAVV